MTKSIKRLLLIFVLALFLRLIKLDVYPFGFHADEVRVGWNALSISKTGRDDRGNALALYYNTFGDFRPTGIFYATIPAITLFGRNEFAVRFPAALFGALTVFPFYFFICELLKSKNRKPIADSRQLPLIASLLLAVSPWHLVTSRATSEVIISLFFALWGFYFLIKTVNNQKIKFTIYSFLFLAVSYFFYHSVRLSAPMFVGVMILYFWREIKQSKLTGSVLVILGGLTLLTGILVINKEARGRFSQVSIFSDLDVKYELSRMPFEEGQGKVFIARLFHNKPIAYAKRFINEYARYFSADFFLNPETAKPARYTTVGVGILSYIELLLLVCGLIAIAQKKSSLLPLLLLLIAPIPGALTTEDAPNLHRALYMIPFILIIGAYGFNWLIESFPKYKSSFLELLSRFFHGLQKSPFVFFRSVAAREVKFKQAFNY
jgi:4-amino-4-deoxy-L-arabinose transferase-like glycosyltransferase